MEYLNPSGTLPYRSCIYFILGFAALASCLHVIIPFATSPLHVYPQHVSGACGDTLENWNAWLQPLYVDLRDHGVLKDSFGSSIPKTEGVYSCSYFVKRAYLYMELTTFSRWKSPQFED
ncbi:hypothetical protein BDV37DRAFT_229417 [Aspergillus pseudonomiae]|uniref:Uncharacterized protein n=1 Tax=Aspergillus pseudonomiae TaxID=1506151 RepID=A0A5N7CZ26_9EURO|nr:uncharacterized protein BDV37DRAFT_229417 [Aspergillus pseudonomiae]KAE8399435.1 hypothetical protein BDV37DRAFT_229417 [Aspergillus pseudonomiae]